MAVFAIGRMKAGIRSRRAAASGLHRTRAGAAASGVASIAANGQPGPPGAAASGSAASRSAPPMAGAWAIDARRCSNGWAGSVRPPTLTPTLLTIWLSNWCVSIATRKPHSGQRKVTASEPSSGPSVARSFIGSSQSRQRNFMAAPFYPRRRARPATQPGARGALVPDGPPKAFQRWFRRAALNPCYNALDLHSDRGRGKQRALVYDSPVTNTTRTFTYRELRDEVARCGGALRAHGVRKGDRVIIYMPMVPEAVIAMLACARIGAIHSVV